MKGTLRANTGCLGSDRTLQSAKFCRTSSRLRGLWLQDRVGVIADQLIDISGAIPARPVCHRAGAHGGGSTSGQVRCAHIPEKSGMDAPLWIPPILAGSSAGATSCSKAGLAAAAANVTNKRNSHRGAFMLPSLSSFPGSSRVKLHPVRMRLEGARCLHPARSSRAGSIQILPVLKVKGYALSGRIVSA